MALLSISQASASLTPPSGTMVPTRRRGKAGVLDAELQLLVDKQALNDVLFRYCRGVDRCDRDLIASAYHADAHDHHGPGFQGSVEAFIEWVIPRQMRWDVGMHLLTNTLFDVRGNVAFGESRYMAIHSRSATAEQAALVYVAAGRYIDRFERRDGEWRIARRRTVVEWGEERTTLPGGQLDEPMPRDRTDISYERDELANPDDRTS